jgi:PST family polysaccharide transporter
MSGGALQNVLASLLIGVFSGPVALGAYNAIDRIARTASAALKPIFQTLYPHMALLHKKDRLNAKRVMTKYLVIVIVLILFVISLSVPISKYLIYYIYGSKLISYSSLLIILLVWLSFGIINNMIGIQGLLASGRDVEYTIGIWICVITSIVTGLLSVGKQDFIYWVGASVALGELLALIYYFYSYYKHLPDEKIIKVHEKEGDSLGVYRSVV